ncbi:MAG: RecX family transcriptional regulator [Alphaproteobacteria bacterium]|nr:MAG: RecX family transcriptional regulator [Alphaproteobacteria bacterium]
MRNDNTKNDKKIKERKVPKKISERYLRNSGEYYLNRFPASSNHFITVMTRKIDRSCHEHTDQDRNEWISHVKETLVPYFQKIGFLNDTLFAQALFNSLKQRGLSRNAIYRRMTLKGLEREHVQKLISNGDDGVNDKEAVLIFAKKKKVGKFRIDKTTDPKEKQKDLGKLARAGFSYEIAMSVF